VNHRAACLAGIFGSLTCLQICIAVGTKSPALCMGALIAASVGGLLTYHFIERIKS